MYDPFADYYDLEYSHKDDDLDFYLDMAEEFGSPILEIGVGTGRVAADLIQNGYTVYGIDNSKKMLDVAAEKIEDNEKLLLFHQSMDNLIIDQKFPLCIIPFRAFLHNLSQEEQLATLNNIREHLLPDGVLAFDLFVPLHNVLANDEWIDEISADELAQENSDISIDVKINHQPEKQLLTIQNSYKNASTQSTHETTMKYRYVFKNEMELLLKLSGFVTQEVYGGFDYQEYDYKSGIMVFIARKQS